VISGSVYINFGWSLMQSGKSIPTDGHKDRPDRGAMLELQPASNGRRFAAVNQLDRIVLRFNNACGVVTARQLVSSPSRSPSPAADNLGRNASRLSWLPALRGSRGFRLQAEGRAPEGTIAPLGPVALY
jgi:hypothetical protein